MQNVNPESKDLQQQIVEIRDRLSGAEGEIRQLNRTAWDTSKQTIWQFIIFTITMAAVVIGALNYQTGSLNKQLEIRSNAIEQRIDTLEKRLDQRIDQVNHRIDQVEKNFNDRFDDFQKTMNSRFDDLKQEVRKK